jgi:F-box protein 9
MIMLLQGLCVGTWELQGSTVFLDSLADPSGTAARYVFRMTLQLRSKPLGRWNRLEFVAYDSVNLDTGEAVPVSLKHERWPFLFSRVRSYHL